MYILDVDATRDLGMDYGAPAVHIFSYINLSFDLKSTFLDADIAVNVSRFDSGAAGVRLLVTACFGVAGQFGPVSRGRSSSRYLFPAAAGPPGAGPQFAAANRTALAA